MPVSFDRRRFVASLMSISVSGTLTGCGTLLHPERRGQVSGQLDWRIVGLDAAGMLLFVVPGVIAFAVDFYEGTIFLPAGSAGLGPEESAFDSVRVSRADLSRKQIEQTVSKHVNQPVVLAPGAYSEAPLYDLKNFRRLRDYLMHS